MRFVPLLLLASTVAAEPRDPGRRLVSRFHYGLNSGAGLTVRYFEQERLEFLYGRGDLILDVCRRAADMAFLLDDDRDLKDRKKIAVHLDALVTKARGARADLARLEAQVFRAKVERLGGAKSGKKLREVAVRMAEAATRAADVLRASELLLQTMHWTPEDRGPGLAALQKLAQRDGLGAPARDTLHATLTLTMVEPGGPGTSDDDEQAVLKALALLAPHTKKGLDAAVRRHNDLVSVATGAGMKKVKTKYRTVDLKPWARLRMPVPRSRHWAVFEASYPGGITVALWLVHPTGEPVCRLRLRRYAAGDQYPAHPKQGKQADGGNVKRLARVFYGEELWLYIPRKHKRHTPKSVRIGRGIKRAYQYEVWGAFGKGWQRVRAIFFAGKGGWSYSIRMVENDPGFGESWHPELEALKKGLELEKR